jgi:hypothetical protein
MIAARAGDRVLIAARARGADRLVLSDLALAGTRSGVAPLDLGPASGSESAMSLLAGASGVAWIAPAPGDAGARRLLTGLDAQRTQRVGPLEVGDAACATVGAVAWVDRAEAGWRLRSWAFGAPAEASGPSLPASVDVAIECGQTRVFAVTGSADAAQVVSWVPGAETSAGAVLVPPLAAGGGGDRDERPAMTVASDTLILAAVGRAATLAVWAWSGDGAAPAWLRTKLRVGEGAGVEVVEASEDAIGILTTREVEASRGCPSGSDPTDTIAEIALVGRADGRVMHPLERVESWRCGAEPARFWSGMPGGRFVAAWARGADAACVRAGVRRGGVGFVSVDAGGGRATIGRAGRPAETFADAGCDERACYVAAITRGPDACAPVDGAAAGAIELFSFP